MWEGERCCTGFRGLGDELASVRASGDVIEEPGLEGRRTEQRAISLNVRAEGMGGMVYAGALS